MPVTHDSTRPSAWPSILTLAALVALFGAGCPLSIRDGWFRAHGMVVDLAGKPVPGATVRTWNWDQGAITDGRGCFLISEITRPDKHQMPFSVDASGSKGFNGTLAAPGPPALRLRVVLADATSDTRSVVDSSPASEILFSCEPSSAWLASNGSSEQNAHSARITALSELAAHVGEYPCRNGLLESPVFKTAFQDALPRWYESAIKYSSCGAVAQRGSWILLDLFLQQHWEGFTLLMLVNPQTTQVYVSGIPEPFWRPELFWSPTRVDDRKAEIHGPSPVPRDVSRIIVDELAATWGHAVSFSWRDGAIHFGRSKVTNTGGRSGG